MRRLLLTGVLVVSALSGFVQGGTVAYFTSSATSTANQFTAGTVDISHSPASSLITLSNMVPGDRVTNPMTVTNDGTLSLTYAVSSNITNVDGKGLGAQLDLKIKTGVTTCSNLGFDTDGSTIYDGKLGSTGGSLNLIGNPSTHPNGGRTLAAGSSEILCFQASLPTLTGSSFAGAATTATLSFSAEQ